MEWRGIAGGKLHAIDVGVATRTPGEYKTNIRPRSGGTAEGRTDVIHDDVAVGKIKAEFCFVSLNKNRWVGREGFKELIDAGGSHSWPRCH